MKIWNEKVMKVLIDSHNRPSNILFGITGDIDNLGVYVSRNGRAKAENLVDIYNVVIESIFYDFIKKHPNLFFETCFIPSGEEIFILGICKDQESALLLFQYINFLPVPSLILENTNLDLGITNITFGCKILKKSSIYNKLLNSLIKSFNNCDYTTCNNNYVRILVDFRNQLAVELDIKKFSNLTTDGKVAILIRNLVYVQTLEYKRLTKEIIDMFVSKLTDLRKHRKFINLLGSTYGIASTDSKKLNNKIFKLL